MGSMGLAASANLNPARSAPSLFEPVHGSAPDIAGEGKANPLAAVWSMAMMFEHLGESEASRRVMDAVEDVARTGPHTGDVGGAASTDAVAAALLGRLD